MIEVAVCDDDANDLNHTVGVLHDIFAKQNIGYHLKSFLSANEMLESIKKLTLESWILQ